jgi:hypothetical protein
MQRQGDVPRVVVVSKVHVLVCESGADEDVLAVPRHASELVDARGSIPRCHLEALQRPRVAPRECAKAVDGVFRPSAS